MREAGAGQPSSRNEMVRSASYPKSSLCHHDKLAAWEMKSQQAVVSGMTEQATTTEEDAASPIFCQSISTPSPSPSHKCRSSESTIRGALYAMENVHTDDVQASLATVAESLQKAAQLLRNLGLVKTPCTEANGHASRRCAARPHSVSGTLQDSTPGRSPVRRGSTGGKRHNATLPRHSASSVEPTVHRLVQANQSLRDAFQEASQRILVLEDDKSRLYDEAIFDIVNSIATQHPGNKPPETFFGSEQSRSEPVNGNMTDEMFECTDRNAKLAQLLLQEREGLAKQLQRCQALSDYIGDVDINRMARTAHPTLDVDVHQHLEEINYEVPDESGVASDPLTDNTSNEIDILISTQLCDERFRFDSMSQDY